MQTMDMARRLWIAGAAAVLPIAATFDVQAQVTDIALMCDLTLGPAMRRAASAYRTATGVRVHVFPSAPGLIVPMLSHEVQIDIVATRIATLDQGDRAGLLAPGSRAGTWRTPLVVAEGAGAGTSDKFAVSELPSASGIDAQTAIARLGIDPKRIVSAIDTEEVAFLLTTGAARSGLLYLTDTKADPRLIVVQTLADPPPAVFATALAKESGRPNPGGFTSFLGSAAGRTLLGSQGLEYVT